MEGYEHGILECLKRERLWEGIPKKDGRRDGMGFTYDLVLRCPWSVGVWSLR